MMKVNNSIEFMPVSEGQAPLTEAQFKEAFFACHPYQWQQSFREHNEPSEVDIGRIASFMRLKAQDAAKRERDNQLKQKSNGNRHRPITKMVPRMRVHLPTKNSAKTRKMKITPPKNGKSALRISLKRVTRMIRALLKRVTKIIQLVNVKLSTPTRRQTKTVSKATQFNVSQ